MRDTEGSYLCQCLVGFTDVNGDGKECENINECELYKPLQIATTTTSTLFTTTAYSSTSASTTATAAFF